MVACATTWVQCLTHLGVSPIWPVNGHPQPASCEKWHDEGQPLPTRRYMSEAAEAELHRNSFKYMPALCTQQSLGDGGQDLPAMQHPQSRLSMAHMCSSERMAKHSLLLRVQSKDL